MLNITEVSGVSPNWVLRVASTTGILVNDIIATPLPGLPVGRGAPYRVTNVPDSTHIEIRDDQKVDGGLYGQPGTGTAQFFTPTVNYRLSLPVDNGPHWGELFRRDNLILDGRVRNKIEVSFSFSDFVGGSLLIGTIGSGSRVASVSLIVVTAFNAGQLTVGDSIGQGRLMTAAENYLMEADTFKTEKDILYAVDTAISVYFSGAPIQGSGTVVVYFNK
jgi:hypothetical protein